MRPKTRLVISTVSITLSVLFLFFDALAFVSVLYFTRKLDAGLAFGVGLWGFWSFLNVRNMKSAWDQIIT